MTEKRVRLWTNRSYAHRRDYEAVDIDSRGVMFWTAIEHRPNGEVVEASFPCGIDMVEDCFARTGRSFDLARLPSNAVLNPYC